VFLDDPILAVALVAIFLLVAYPVHEFAHAWAAYMQGDATAKLFGRLTLNPIVHFDPIGGTLTAVSLLFSPILFGWAKPTPVNPLNLQGGRRGEAIVAAAGPVSNFVLAAVAALPLRFILAQDTLIVPDIVVQVLFLFVHPALLAMDATLEEAARMAGASAWRTVWRINFPLLLPALLASGILSFVVAMESFEIPQLLGTPANIFVFTEPLAGWRQVSVRRSKTKVDWATELAALLEGRYASCEKVILVCDNLNTHTKGAFYEVFQPSRARELVRRIEFRHTPRHGSWLNIAENERT